MNTDHRTYAGRQRWCRTALVATLLGCNLAAYSEEKPAPKSPERRELWVPTKHWQQVLKHHPSAVMLTPDEYEALVRDAGKIPAPKTDEKLPANAVIEHLRFKASAVDDGAELLRVDGELTLRCLTDEWTEVTARLPFRNLAAATVDGNVVLGLPEEVKKDQTTATQRKLLVRGKGTHRITVQVLARPGTSSLANTRSFAFHTIDAPATLELKLPPSAQITQATTSYSRQGDVVQLLVYSPGGPELRSIAWTTTSAIVQPARQASAVGETTVTDHSIETAWDIAVQRSTTDTSTQIGFDVVPPEAIVLSLDGEGITRWEQQEGKVTVTLRERIHALQLRARLQTVVDLQASAKPQALVLPMLQFQGQHAKDSEARVTAIAEGVTLMEFQGAVPALDGVIRWNPLRDPVRLLLRKADPRISVDADAKAVVTRDALQIDRTLVIQTDRPTNELRVTLPVGEEFIKTATTKGPAPEWKRAGQTIEYRWAMALHAAQPAMLTLSSRKRLDPTKTVNSLTVENVTISDARKVAGYFALDFDPTWRVSVKSANGLEERDARVTPVKGKMAWFGLRTFSLAFDAQRRDPVYDADITAYALPRAKTIEIEGEIALNVYDAPLRQLKVTVAKEAAGLLRFTSPLVGEQTLDAATGVWSLTLRKETLGRLPLRFRLSLPATLKDSKTAGQVTLDALLPTITVNSVRRQRGVWVVEANTDTELTFDAKSMQPLDVLRAPAIEGYEPRHRLVAAFEHGTPDASLTLHAARHGHSELASVVVTELQLISVLSLDGNTRHQALLGVQHSGEQFLNVTLPEGAQLLTVMADSTPVKPVRGPNGALSIPLPAGSANKPQVPVRLLYETSGTAWTASGQRQLQPLVLSGDIPVLATDWQVYVPDGFSFKKVKTTLEQEGTGLWKGLHREPQSETGYMLEDKPAATSPAPAPPSGIADREMARRMSRIEDGRQAIERGDAAYASDGYEAAAKHYQTALESLPNAPTTRDWIKLAESRLADALVAHARVLAKAGKYTEAHQFVTQALTHDSGHKAARRLQADLNDPDRYPAARTPDAIARAEQVERSLHRAQSYSTLGDYDGATRELQQALRTDPYNVAARRGMERVEQHKSEYYDAARDHTRALMLNLVTESWEEKVPLAANSEVGAATRDMSAYMVDKLKQIPIPSIQLKDATIDEAIEYLRMKSRDLDEYEKDPSRKGINIILKSGDVPSTARINLDLKDVPMEEALRYVTELAGMKYKVEPFAIIVVPVTESTSEQYTRVYKMPPDFMQWGQGATGAPKTAKDILISQGILFPEGASAVYSVSSSQLIVKNTAPNLDLVETFCDSMSVKAGPNATSSIMAAEFAIDWPAAGAEAPSPMLEKMRTIRLPLVQFAGASFQECLDFLALKAKEQDETHQGVSFAIKPGTQPTGQITLDLKDVPFEEALRYVTELAGVKYKLESNRVLIVPPTDDIAERMTRTWGVPTKFLQLAKINGPVKDALVAQGIAFPEGTSATHDAQVHRLTVTNTFNNLALVESYLETIWNQAHEKPPVSAAEVQRRLARQAEERQSFATGDSTLFPGAADVPNGLTESISFKEGLLPLELELPSAGQRLRFHGAQGPVVLALKYVSWERQIVHACLLMLAGASLFLAFGRERAWRSTFLAVLVLVFGTGLWLEEWQPLANAVLLGWLGALVLCAVWKLIKAFETGMTEGRQA